MALKRARYYAGMKALAHETRDRYNITTADISLTTLRHIYKLEGIHLDYWPYKLRKVRGAYFLLDDDPHVMVYKSMPTEPRIFCLCHELKHHHVDQERARCAGLLCQDASWDDADPVEIGAEIFAAEFIFPEDEFLCLIRKFGLENGCTAEDVVRLKRSSPAPVSYTFLKKRLQRTGTIEPGQFDKVQFTKLEYRMYGMPFCRMRKLGSARGHA